MNKLKVCVFVLCILTLACLGAARADNSKADPAAKSPTGMNAMDEKLMAMVKQLWEQYKTKDSKGFGAGLSDDCMEVTPMGMVVTKAQILEAMAGDTISEYSLTDMKVQWLDKDCALVHYTATAKGTMKDGKALPAGPIHCTTAFVGSGGKWLAKFHQETPVMSTMH